MWRPLFMAIGITLIMLGCECLVVKKAIFADEFSVKPPLHAPTYSFEPVARKRTFTPPEWAPWSLLSAGSIVLLYSITLRREPSGE